MRVLDVAVVGGGISGLTAAIALAQNGHKVRLYEAAPAFAEVGAGITLAPNAMRGMDYVGVGDEICELGIEPHQQQISHWQNDSPLRLLQRSNSREKYGAAYVYIHRAELHGILTRAAQAAGVDMLLDKQLIGVDHQPSLPVMHFADGSAASAAIVVGADGLKSQVRKLFAPKAAQFTGHIAYRAIASASPALEDLIALPGMHIGPGKMIVRYPLRKGRLLNLVFFARQDGWTEDGWSIAAEKQELYQLYKGWSADAHTMLDSIQAGTVFKWAINAHQPLDSWHVGEKVVLVGDAAHAMTPFLGQGAATGIEDAVILARALSASSNIEDAFRRYENVQLDRANYIQKESNLNADRLQGDETELYGVGNLVNEETLGLFSYDCISVAV